MGRQVVSTSDPQQGEDSESVSGTYWRDVEYSFVKLNSEFRRNITHFYLFVFAIGR